MPYKRQEDRAAYQRQWKAAHRAIAKANGDTESYLFKRGKSGGHAKRDAQRKEERQQRPVPHFAAFDGEGTNQENGDQFYTLLCWTGPDGSEDYIENYRTGLSTSACLNFLVKHKPAYNTINTGFFFTYDVTKIIRDLTQTEKMALWESGWIIWQDDRTPLRYYIRFIPNKIFKVGVIAHEVTHPTRETFNPNKDLVKSTTLFDVSGFFQVAFVKALKQWDVALDVVDRIAAMKAKRNDFAEESPDAIRTYCFRECHALTELLDKLARALWDADLRLTSWHGAGAIADALFRQHGVQEHLEDVPAAVLPACLGAYFGGRAEIFRQGIIGEPVHDYDLQSAYPSAAISLPSLKGATWEHDTSTATTSATSHDWTLALVSWDVVEIVGRRGIPYALPGPLPHRYKGRVSFPYEAGPTWVHGLELRAALAIFPAECFTIHEAWILHPATDDRPFAFLTEVARERIRAKAAGEWKHIPMKLGMNSVYGKLAQGQIEETRQPAFLSYFWAGAITAMTRAKLLLAAHQAGYGLVAIMTDGLFTTQEVALPLGHEPGTWEYAGSIDNPIIIQAGIMYSRDGSLSKTRGFGKDSLNYETACSIWRQDGALGMIEYTERRFIGLGSCTARNDFETYGRWLTVDRLVHFQMLTAPKTQWPDALGFYWGYDLARWPDHQPESFWVVPKDFGSIASEPFVPRPLHTDDAAWAALDERTRQEIEDLRLYKIEHYDQPEWDGEWEDEV